MGLSRYSAVAVILLGIGCVHQTEPETPPPSVAPAPDTSETGERPKAVPPTAKTQPSTAAETPSPSTSATPAPATPTKPRPQPAATPRPTPAPKPTAAPPTPTAATTTPTAAAPTLDLDALKTRLRHTKAIGLMTKLSIKNQVDDLLDEFRRHHAGKPTPTEAELRRSYDLLMMKVLSLLQDQDRQLASDILASRERIWDLLADPKKFAALQA